MSESLIEQLRNQPVILSPMAGYSDSPYRTICRRHGSGFSFTEFVSTTSLVGGSARSIRLFEYREVERPVIFQVFGNNPDVIIDACVPLVDLQPDGIDLNMGCSVKKVAHKGSGAGLLRDLRKVRTIVSRMVRELQIPISVKIRLGWDEQTLNYREVAKIIEGEGAWAISVHGRTRSQGYTGHADWDAIGEIKQAARIPVIGNGDIVSRKDALARMQSHGVDGVMIGRAAIGNPWLFSGRSVLDLDYGERLPAIIQHLGEMTTFYGGDQGVLLFRKHLAKYLKGVPGYEELKQRAFTIENEIELVGLLNAHQRAAAAA